jgi:hypothetical protein
MYYCLGAFVRAFFKAVGSKPFVYTDLHSSQRPDAAHVKKALDMALVRGAFEQCCASDIEEAVACKLAGRASSHGFVDRVRVVYAGRDVVAFVYEEVTGFREEREELGSIVRVHVYTLAHGVHDHRVVQVDIRERGRAGVAKCVARSVAAFVDDAVLTTLLPRDSMCMTALPVY